LANVPRTENILIPVLIGMLLLSIIATQYRRSTARQHGWYGSHNAHKLNVFPKWVNSPEIQCFLSELWKFVLQFFSNLTDWQKNWPTNRGKNITLWWRQLTDQKLKIQTVISTADKHLHSQISQPHQLKRHRHQLQWRRNSHKMSEICKTLGTYRVSGPTPEGPFLATSAKYSLRKIFVWISDVALCID